jgi:hypothetical protein
MTDQKKRPLWPVITALLIGLPVLYVLSFGPAMWLCRLAIIQGVDEARAAEFMLAAYAPLLWLTANGPESFGYALYWYGHLFP